MPELTIIIPACNEELSLGQTVDRLQESVKLDYEIVIVNDHSTDKTKEAALALADKYKNIRVVDNLGPGSFVNALVRGIGNCKSDYFVPVMADLCDDPATINAMYARIREGYDIVVGSRYISGGERIGGSCWKAFFSNFVGNTLNCLIGIPTRDVPNAFKMYRRSIMEGIEIKARGFEVSAEIPLKAYFLGARIAEVPTVWREREAGKSHFKLFKMGSRYIPLYLWAIWRGIGFRLCRFFR